MASAWLIKLAKLIGTGIIAAFDFIGFNGPMELLLVSCLLIDDELIDIDIAGLLAAVGLLILLIAEHL